MLDLSSTGHRLMKALALVLAAAAIAAPGALAEKDVPGVTDFPSVPAKATYVPGVTDFPSRLGERGEQDARDRVARAVWLDAQSSGSTRGFDWDAAGIGAGLAAAGMLLAAVALRTRPRVGAIAHQPS